jgi:amidohydrolase
MKRSLHFALAICIPIAWHCHDGPSGSADEPAAWVESQLPTLLDEYYWLHQHPELSLHEESTAQHLAQVWSGMGFTVTSKIGGHGLAAVLQNGEGPTVMLRCDLDALPVEEETGLPYASIIRTKTPEGIESGVMHACGHDLHMTSVTGTAQYLASHRDRWQGTLMLIGQPAEERGLGARAMLQDKLFERVLKPDFAVALHCDAQLASGTVTCRGGFVLANVDSVDIHIKGRGGHGSAPHTTIDPVVQAAQLIVDLQSIVSREIDPRTPAVITVGSIHGGSKHNIIGDDCHLQLTVRSYEDAVRKHLLDAIQRKAKAVAESFRAPEPTVAFSEGTPALENNSELAQRLAARFAQTIGSGNVSPGEPVMGGEDFSEFGLAGIPIVMFRLGTVEANRLKQFEESGIPAPSLHSPRFYPDAEPSLRAGLLTLIAACHELMPKH